MKAANTVSQIAFLDSVFTALNRSAPSDVRAEACVCDDPAAAIRRIGQLRDSKNPLRVINIWKKEIRIEMRAFLDLLAGK